MTRETTAFRLTRNEFADLVLTDADGSTHVGVMPVRMFPFTEPTRWIALVDSQKREVATIDDLGQLPEELQRLVLDELRQREFLPEIQRIVSVSSDTEPCEWKVETDRGPTSFILKSEDDVRRLAPHHYLVSDGLGQRYVVSDTRQLDSFSRRVMEEYS
jgi:hypothetical protein